MGNTGEVGEFRKRERKKAGSEESVKINVIFAERKKNGREARLPYWRTFPGT